MLIDANPAKAVDTRVNTARSIISTASLLIAGFSFLAFQYLEPGQPILKVVCVVAMFVLLLAIQRCIRITTLASNIYADGEPAEAKRYRDLAGMLTFAFYSVFATTLIFLGMIAALSFGGFPQNSVASERLHYQCDVDYGAEGNRTATMSCIRTNVPQQD